MAQYYKPGVSDSSIDVSADDINKYLGGEAGLQNSGYVAGTPPPASPTPSPTPTPTPTGEPERYSRLPTGVTQEQYDSANKAKYETKTPEQAAEEYRQSALKAAQDRINNINNVYADRLKSELALQAPVNENNLGRTNALSALMGLGGSSSADTRTTVTEQRNAEINRGISNKNSAEKMEALERIYGEIDSGASKAAAAQLETNKANQAKLLEDVKSNALSQVSALASTLADTGKTFDDWKNADGGEALQKIMEQTGQSEYQVRSAWNNAIPENLRPTIHTSYVDDGKGGTIMRQVTFNPITKKAESQDYKLAVPASTFNGTEKPIEGKNGELFVRQADGTYKDVSPNAENNKLISQAAAYKFIPATKYQPAGYDVGGKFVPLKKIIASDPSNGFTSNPQKITDTTTELDNAASGSILKQTGLSLVAFNYLTKGTEALTRMSAAERGKVMKEAEGFLNKNNLDVSTFQSQYKAYNEVLQKNINRMNSTKIMENEINGTLENLGEQADLSDLGKVRYKNLAKIWAGQEVNDPVANKYAFHLQQLKNEMAAYFAASQGKASPDVVDNQDAERAIKDGINKGSIDGLKEAVHASTGKMGTVMQNSVDATRQATWDLFGVGGNYKPQGQKGTPPPAATKIIEYQGKKYKVDANGNMTPA